MIDFNTVNRLRIAAMLRSYGLDGPLTDDELSARLLDMELRLREVERALGSAGMAVGSATAEEGVC